MLPVIQIGPLALQVPGLVLLVGLWLGLNLAEKYAPRRGVNASLLSNLTLVALVAGVIGARLAYVARYPSAFSASPLSLISLNPGLFDPLGGVVAGVLVAVIYGNRKQMHLLPTLDALVPLLGVMAVSIGLAHIASGNAFGVPTTLPIGIQLWGAKRHPTQIYESMVAIALLWLFWPARLRYQSWRPGSYFFAFVACSAAMRLFLETFRADSLLTQNGLRTVQLAAWVALAVSLWALGRINRSADPITDQES
ncbi:MAG: prolipoprotein diacylglyceryl transferase [Anaerolineales bacterium]